MEEAIKKITEESEPDKDFIREMSRIGEIIKNDSRLNNINNIIKQNTIKLVENLKDTNINDIELVENMQKLMIDLPTYICSYNELGGSKEDFISWIDLCYDSWLLTEKIVKEYENELQ